MNPNLTDYDKILAGIGCGNSSLHYFDKLYQLQS